MFRCEKQRTQKEAKFECEVIATNDLSVKLSSKLSRSTAKFQGVPKSSTQNPLAESIPCCQPASPAGAMYESLFPQHNKSSKYDLEIRLFEAMLA